MKIGRILLTLDHSRPDRRDWNFTHVFNPEWPPHARFHTVAGISMTIGLCLVALWLIWRNPPDRGASLTVAALFPISYWGSFFVAAAIPGSGVEDHPGDLPRVRGLPLNLFIAAVVVLLTIAGSVIARGASRAAGSWRK
jgi:hypothetical protein